MVELETCHQLACSLPEVTEKPHFDKLSFRVGGKVMATLNRNENRICVKLSDVDQDLFCAFDRTVIYPVPNKWGKQGWTLINLQHVAEDTLLDALRAAYRQVAPKKLAALLPAPPDDL